MPIMYSGGQMLFCEGSLAYHQNCCDTGNITQPGCLTIGDIIIPPSFAVSLDSPVGVDGITFTACNECNELQSQDWTSELDSYGTDFVNYQTEFGTLICGASPPTSAIVAVQFTFCNGPVGNRTIQMRMGITVQYTGNPARFVGNLFGQPVERPDTLANRVLTSWSGTTVNETNASDGICTTLFTPQNPFTVTLI